MASRLGKTVFEGAFAPSGRSLRPASLNYSIVIRLSVQHREFVQSRRGFTCATDMVGKRGIEPPGTSCGLCVVTQTHFPKRKKATEVSLGGFLKRVLIRLLRLRPLAVQINRAVEISGEKNCSCLSDGCWGNGCWGNGVWSKTLQFRTARRKSESPR